MIISVVGLVVVAVGAVLFLRSAGGDGSDAAAVAPAPAKNLADPRTDAAAWRTLPSDERVRLRQETLDAIDRKSIAQMEWAAGFFKDRRETGARETVARWAIDCDPSARWAQDVLGIEDCGALIDKALEECPRAEEVQTDAVRAAERLAAKERPASGPWFPKPEMVARVRELIAEMRKDEHRLLDEYWLGVERWGTYQRKLEVMKDFPALREAAGPYVVFVSVGGSPGKDLADVDEIELNRAQRILRETTALFPTLYEGWHRELGPLFGFTRYGPENADFDTLLKIHAFSREEDFERFCREYHTWSPRMAGVRAFYSPEEPRFIVTHDGRTPEEPYETYQTQCHEGVHQLVHFYARELTTRSRGKAPSWSECNTQPLWSGEGFAEFFSAYEGDGDARRWMQPLSSRLELIWIAEEAFAELGWSDWSLAQLTRPAHGGELDRAVFGVAPKLTKAQAKEDRWLAWHEVVRSVYANLYYARAWSLVYFMWYAEESGRPKYRDRYVSYLKREFVVPAPDDKLAKDGVWTSKLFFDAMGLENKAAADAFQAEWRAWISELCKREKTSAWLPTRHNLRRLLGAK